MADPRIIDITLDERTILWRNADVEQERRIAIFDLLEDNVFEPQRVHLNRPANDGTGVSRARCTFAGSMTTCRPHLLQ